MHGHRSEERCVGIEASRKEVVKENDGFEREVGFELNSVVEAGTVVEGSEVGAYRYHFVDLRRDDVQS